MLKAAVAPDLITFNTALDVYAKAASAGRVATEEVVGVMGTASGALAAATATLVEMEAARVAPDIITINAAINGLAKVMASGCH